MQKKVVVNRLNVEIGLNYYPSAALTLTFYYYYYHYS